MRTRRCRAKEEGALELGGGGSNCSRAGEREGLGGACVLEERQTTAVSSLRCGFEAPRQPLREHSRDSPTKEPFRTCNG